jgi:hypothetical protein
MEKLILSIDENTRNNIWFTLFDSSEGETLYSTHAYKINNHYVLYSSCDAFGREVFGVEHDLDIAKKRTYRKILNEAKKVYLPMKGESYSLEDRIKPIFEKK